MGVPQQDMAGFPRSGTPVLKDVRNAVYIGPDGLQTLASSLYSLEVNGPIRGTSTISAGSSVTGTSFSGTSWAGTTTATLTTATTLYAPTEAFINTNITAATAAAPIQRSTRNRITNVAWTGSGTATQNWVTEVMNSVAAPVLSRQRWAFMTGTSTAEGYAEMLSIDSVGRLNVMGATYAAESLTNGALTSGTSWTRTGDFALASNAATYTHSSGVGTLSQASGTLAVAGAANRWYKLVYTASATTTGVTAFIDTTFALNKEYLNLVAGTYTHYFRSAAAPGNFTISATSTAGAVTLDTLSLTQCTSGDVVANGKFTGGGANGLKIDGAGVATFDSTVNMTSPAITTPTGIVKGDVGLGNVDNTSDANKPVSTAQATANALALPKAGGTMSGTINSFNIIPVTTGTYTLGDSTHYNLNTYTTTLNLNSTASLSGASAGVVGLTGRLNTSGITQFQDANATIEYTTNHMSINKLAGGGLYLYEGATAGLRPQLRIYGYCDSGGGLKYQSFGFDAYANFRIGGDGDVFFDSQVYIKGGNHIYMGAYDTDNTDIVFGEGLDASIKYDGTNLVVNPKLVGTGYLSVLGAVVATGTISPQQAVTASAPAYVKGAIYFDTTLNKLRVGGATAWETITSA